MTENFILGRNNKLEHELKALADYINIPYSILQPYQSECFVRHYTKGQVIYFSPQESSNIYFLIEGNITIKMEMYIVILIKSKYYFQSVTYFIRKRLTNCVQH
ncbi:Transcriptional regulator ArcR essential for anaerobic expression of the ADI pathway, Crp/Fnr family [Staphylococcus aureus]|nr:Transcriptional regulator ArcR essential for anaerobic expression of the ADI pathway, Crp/Fnr family [Staphylococcus aureus]